MIRVGIERSIIGDLRRSAERLLTFFNSRYDCLRITNSARRRFGGLAHVLVSDDGVEATTGSDVSEQGDTPRGSIDEPVVNAPVVNAIVGLPDGQGMCVETRTEDETAIEMLGASGTVVRITVRPGGEIVVATDGLARSGHVVTVDPDGVVQPEAAPVA